LNEVNPERLKIRYASFDELMDMLEEAVRSGRLKIGKQKTEEEMKKEEE
jgi:hypothetical protein